MQTLEQLLTIVTLSAARQKMIDLAVSVGFKGAAAWQDGTLPRTLGIEVPSFLLADGSRAAVLIARGGYNDTAEDAWLDLYSKSAYDNVRHAAVRAYGIAVLTSDPSAEPHTIEPEYVVASDVNGVTFRNKTGGVLSPGSSLAVEFEAEVAGSAANIPVNTLTQLQVSLAGVSVNNPGTDGQWLTTVGADRERDPELRARNSSKWATRAYAAPEAAYENWAREANPAVKRVHVDGQTQSDGPGSVRVYIAGDTGDLPGSVADAVEDYIKGITDGIVRLPLGASVYAVSATERPVTVSGVVYHSAAYASDDVLTRVTLAVEDHFRSIPIGGVYGGTDEAGQVLLAQLYAAVMKVPGVINLAITAPLSNVELAPHEVAAPLVSLTASPL